MSNGSIRVIHLAGELEIGRRAELDESLQLDGVANAVLVDCSNVTYADSTALAALLHLHAEADIQGVNVALLIGNRQFARLLQYAGLGHVFEVFETRAAALSYLAKKNAT